MARGKPSRNDPPVRGGLGYAKKEQTIRSWKPRDPSRGARRPDLRISGNTTVRSKSTIRRLTYGTNLRLYWKPATPPLPARGHLLGDRAIVKINSPAGPGCARPRRVRARG